MIEIKIEHGRANHDPLSKSPECLCGAKGVKDPMWDRYYCPINGVWLEGIWCACWCKECLSKRKIRDNQPYDPETPYDDHDYQINPVNEW